MLAGCTLAALYRKLAGVLLGTRRAAPTPRELEPELWNWVKARLADPGSWYAIAYLLMRLPLAIADLAVVAVTAGFALATLSYPIVRSSLAGAAMPLPTVAPSLTGRVGLHAA